MSATTVTPAGATEGQHLPARNAQLYAAGSALLWTFPIPFALVLFAPGLWRIPVGVLVVGAWLVNAARARRLAFSANADGVSITNQFRSYAFPWSDVQRIELRRSRFPAVTFVLGDGKARLVQASGYGKHLRGTTWAIAKTFAPASVELHEDARLWRR